MLVLVLVGCGDEGLPIDRTDAEPLPPSHWTGLYEMGWTMPLFSGEDGCIGGYYGCIPFATCHGEPCTHAYLDVYDDGTGTIALSREGFEGGSTTITGADAEGFRVAQLSVENNCNRTEYSEPFLARGVIGQSWTGTTQVIHENEGCVMTFDERLGMSGERVP